MKISKLFFIIVLSLLVLSLTSCGNDPTPTVETPVVTHAYPPPMNDPEEVAASLTAMPEEEVAAPVEEASDPEPTEEVAAEPQVDNCSECHTNQQALIDTADPVEEVVSENEGEG
jgi:hypothetical protein